LLKVLTVKSNVSSWLIKVLETESFSIFVYKNIFR